LTAGFFPARKYFSKKKDLGEKIPVKFFYSGKFSQADHPEKFFIAEKIRKKFKKNFPEKF